MTYPQTKFRSAFTLVELLVVMTVIAILIGMLSAAVIPAFKRAREASIQVEMKQIELAIESFKNKYGFYPPSFESGTNAASTAVGISSAADLMRFVNRISPNHAEGSASGHGTESRLEHWYDEVGQYLDQESSLVFWLSGICNNKQYPITGGLTGFPPIAAHPFGTDGIERDILFDFKNGQLFGDETDEIVQKGTTGIPVVLRASATVPGFILEYRQAYGPKSGDLLFKYRDAATYDLGGTAADNLAYCDGPADGSAPAAPYAFANPNSFQLITFGMDGLSGAPGNWHRCGFADVTVGTSTFVGFHAADNLCNFADGFRLEKWAADNE